MIEVLNLTKRYGSRSAINELNFKVNSGEIVGFLGPNGAGKSTTMKILAGALACTSGSARIAGLDVFKHPIEVKRNVGYLPETPPLHLEMIVEEYVEYAARLRDVPSSSLKNAVDSALARTGLTGVRKRIIGYLSKGYRQRVGLAQALVHNPKVLILDEPTVGLDPAQIVEIRELVKSLAGQHTVILSTHILPEVAETCKHVIIINHGHIIADGNIDDIQANAAGGLSYCLRAKNLDSNALDQIRKLPRIKSMDQQQGMVTFHVEPHGEEIRDRILSIAVKENMQPLEFSENRVSLEEAYIRLTSQERI